jgi:hypothetical protein
MVVVLVTIGFSTLGPLNLAENIRLERWRSKKGGYLLKIPKGWQAAEALADGAYKGAFGPQASLEDSSDLKQDLVIERNRQHTELFPVGVDNFDQASIKFAIQVAQGTTRKGRITFDQFDNSISGMQSRQFFMTAGLHSDDCTRVWVSLGVKRDEGFLAIGKLPCTDKNIEFLDMARESKEGTFVRVVKSLRVQGTWGSPGA